LAILTTLPMPTMATTAITAGAVPAAGMLSLSHGTTVAKNSDLKINFQIIKLFNNLSIIISNFVFKEMSLKKSAVVEALI